MTDQKQTIHIIGAGVAGLTAATALAQAGKTVRVYEASPHAGGRCRSFHDTKLDTVIDNGNHVLLGANPIALDWVKRLGTFDQLDHTGDSGIAFVDIQHNASWQWQPTLQALRQIPGVSVWAIIRDIFAMFVPGNKAVGSLQKSALYEPVWKPACESMLNTPPQIASLRLFASLIKTMMRSGKDAGRAYFPKESWDEVLIQPMINTIEKAGGSIMFKTRLTGLDYDQKRVSALQFNTDKMTVNEGDTVILATPAQQLSGLFPEVQAPDQHHAIVNVHFKINHSVKKKMLGFVRAATHWAFMRDGIIATTTSAADDLAEKSDQEIAEIIWLEAQQALDIDDSLPPFRVIKEKRATFSCSNAQLQKRPSTETPYTNLFLAGDYLNTGLPATLEGAIRSGLNIIKLIS